MCLFLLKYIFFSLLDFANFQISQELFHCRIRMQEMPCAAAEGGLAQKRWRNGLKEKHIFVARTEVCENV